MISDELREIRREVYRRRIARGEKFGFQKGHKGHCTPMPEELKQKLILINRSKPKKPYPNCLDCDKKLLERRAERCRSCSQKFIYTNPEARLKVSQRQTGKTWKVNPKYLPAFSARSRGRKMSPEARAKMRKWHVENPNRKFKDTGIELIIENFLKSQGINFIKQAALFGIAKVDFYIPQNNLVIQCDGCYWHGCPTHYPLHNQKQAEKDAKKDNLLAGKGLTVYRIWEHDINAGIFNLPIS